nr:fatty acyl-AMP ligase [Pseudomonas sp. BIGb0427]
MARQGPRRGQDLYLRRAGLRRQGTGGRTSTATGAEGRHRATTTGGDHRHATRAAVCIGVFACLYAGIAAVPVYPQKKNESSERLCRVISDAGAQLLITDRLSLAALLAHEAITGLVQVVDVDQADPALAGQWQAPAIDADSVAFIQYTSGSTGIPKGVVVTHANLMSNEQMIAESLNHDHNTVYVSWLPVFHDLGLIGLLQAVLPGRALHPYVAAGFCRQPVALAGGDLPLPRNHQWRTELRLRPVPAAHHARATPAVGPEQLDGRLQRRRTGAQRAPSSALPKPLPTVASGRRRIAPAMAWPKARCSSPACRKASRR